MPRYLVEREFPAGLPIGADAAGAQACREVVEVNAGNGAEQHLFQGIGHTGTPPRRRSRPNGRGLSHLFAVGTRTDAPGLPRTGVPGSQASTISTRAQGSGSDPSGMPSKSGVDM